MMNKRTIVIPLGLFTLFLGTMTACSQPHSSASPQADSSPVTAQAKAEQNTVQAAWRESIRKKIEPILTQDQNQRLSTELQQGEKMHQALSELNLTPDQHAKVQEILRADRAEQDQKREMVRKQIEAVLTPDQVKQMGTKVQQGEKLDQAALDLDLTTDQKTKIQGILQAAYPHP